ncbi:amidohydrolase family protein [Edaphosphingomonas haloaromaticamans]|uniref:Amidohydrolase n=1 Tax=Edaphosphingomonas haloaromaticamans TaxID=653954 RepID=A0A1S1HBX9_9SPHN|nr:amidohydrolase family protein [Sphingomonas haloaromaticamans]OHT19312.1 Amidohydrolase [Sphingomonas haloaromaticamans]
MPFPTDVRVVDLMLNVPVSATNEEWYTQFLPLLMDKESRQAFKMPAQYMFKGIPNFDGVDDLIGHTFAEMDKHNIGTAMMGFYEGSDHIAEIGRRFGDRVLWELPVNPNEGMDEVRRIKRLHKDHGIAALSIFPCGLNPQVPINDKKMYLLYAAAVELDIPVMVNVGVPGPRVPMAPQKVELVDEVCWFFPELKFIMRHGAEPWDELAVKLMIKYPNLYYSTSAFAPRYYPKSIVDFANTRGANQVLYAGYYPSGLSLDRIFAELPEVPFKDEVWPKFLRDNAKRLFKIKDPA